MSCFSLEKLRMNTDFQSVISCPSVALANIFSYSSSSHICMSFLRKSLGRLITVWSSVMTRLFGPCGSARSRNPPVYVTSFFKFSREEITSICSGRSSRTIILPLIVPSSIIIRALNTLDLSKNVDNC